MWTRVSWVLAAFWVAWYRAKHSLWGLMIASCAVGLMLGVNLKILVPYWPAIVAAWHRLWDGLGPSP